MWNFPIKPEAASEHAASYDALFNTITLLTVIFTVLVGVLVLFLAFRYRRGSKVDRRNPLEHSLPLELSWSFLPLLLAMGIFGWSTYNFIEVRKMPKDATEIFVIGKQWMWHLQHMNGIRENSELHIPVGKPVKLTMISQDVIHAMYLPEFRAQYHVVPGRYTSLQFTPTKTGRFKMLCAMHCGTQHSQMVGQVYVLSERDYAEWLEKKGNRFVPKALTMVEQGKQVWEDKKCGSCHNDYDNVKAPSLIGIYGKKREFSNAPSQVADDDYIRDSIVNPYRLMSAGYRNTMQAYRGQLSEKDLLGLVAYIRSLTAKPGLDGGKSDFEPAGPATQPVPSGNANSTDVANRQGSAGAAQFDRSEKNK